MGTIVLGLLIAIGLEQTVEHLHQRSEVHRLEGAVEVDNHEILPMSLKGQEQVSQQLVLLSQREADVRHLLNEHGAAARFPRIVTEGFWDHSDAAWKTAKTNGIAPLVPEQENEILSEVDVDVDQLHGDMQQQWVPCTNRIAFEREFAVVGAANEMDLSHASAADLTQYLDLLREEIAADVRLRADYVQLRGLTTAILQGERDPEKVFAAESRFITGRQFMEQ